MPSRSTLWLERPSRVSKHDRLIGRSRKLYSFLLFVSMPLAARYKIESCSSLVHDSNEFKKATTSSEVNCFQHILLAHLQSVQTKFAIRASSKDNGCRRIGLVVFNQTNMFLAVGCA